MQLKGNHCQQKVKVHTKDIL